MIALGAASAALAAIALATAASSAGAGDKAYADEVRADGPASFWRFGDLHGSWAVDQIGRRSGVYRGSPRRGEPGAIGGDTDAAVALDGRGDSVVVPTVPAIGSRAGLTIELWVRRARGNATQTLVAARGAGSAGGYAIWIDPKNRVRARFTGAAKTVTLVSRSPLDTSWHHVVALTGSGTSRLFVDGIRHDRAPTAPIVPRPATMMVGATVRGRSPLRGALDELAIYSGQLHPDRIRAHRNAALRGGAPPPLPLPPEPVPPPPPPPPPPPADTTPPSIAITSPSGGASITTAGPSIAGTAGTAPGDQAAIAVTIHAGSQTAGIPVRTLATSRAANGTFAVPVAPPLPNGTYTAQAAQSDAAGNIGRSPSRTFTIAVPPAPTLIGAGDIAGCGTTPKDAETAALLAQYPDDTVFTLGDNTYDSGTAAEFSACYGPTWGVHRARTRPTVGDHDLGAGNPNGYLDYFHQQLTPFGPTATDPTKMYYSYDLGAWHVVHLNAVCFYFTPGCNVAAQEAWFAADLAAHPAACTLVMMSSPRFSSGSVHGTNPDMQNLWAIAYSGGVELVLSGDDHIYERFAPMDGGGVADPQFGVRQMIVGTGGFLLYPIGTVKANSEVRYTASAGVVRLRLNPTSYDWQFVPIDGLPTPDAGSANCHGQP